MNSVSENELRELDAWIAEYVLGYVWLPDHGRSGKFYLYDKPTPLDLKESKHGLSPIEHGVHHRVPSFTTDAAEALKVLEKCVFAIPTHHEIKIGMARNGSFLVSVQYDDFEPNSHKDSNADTLPLAICLFAKQLFSKP